MWRSISHRVRFLPTEGPDILGPGWDLSAINKVALSAREAAARENGVIKAATQAALHLPPGGCTGLQEVGWGFSV